MMSVMATLIIQYHNAGRSRRQALGEFCGAVRAGAVGVRRAALDTQSSRSDPGRALFLHQRISDRHRGTTPGLTLQLPPQPDLRSPSSVGNVGNAAGAYRRDPEDGRSTA